MDFALTEEITLVRDMAKDFAERELMPRAKAHDRQGFIDQEVFDKLGELGFWGLTTPEKYGGHELGNLPLAVVLEEINRPTAIVTKFGR